jgi:hypothetical protein
MVPLTCFWTKRRLAPYLDGALSPGLAPKVEGHLQGCAGCRREASRLERQRGLLRGDLGVVPDPDWSEFWGGIRRRILTERARPWREAWGEGLWRPVSWYPRLALGGALAGAVVLAAMLWQSGPPQTLVPFAGVVVSAVETAHPDGNLVVFSSPEEEMTVIWVFGLDQPADQSRHRSGGLVLLEGGEPISGQGGLLGLGEVLEKVAQPRLG